ncbi:10383_t:CDS:2, partial [Entrophospora sp. SA101]
PGPGDGGVDITGNFVRIPIIIQCKDQRRGIGPAVVRELEGVLTKCHEDTIGIVVVPAKNKFNDGAVERAGTSKCNIILTDKRDLYLDLIRCKSSKKRNKKNDKVVIVRAFNVPALSTAPSLNLFLAGTTTIPIVSSWHLVSTPSNSRTTAGPTID